MSGEDCARQVHISPLFGGSGENRGRFLFYVVDIHLFQRDIKVVGRIGRSKKREVKYETRSAKHLDSSLGRYPYSPERFLLKTMRFFAKK